MPYNLNDQHLSAITRCWAKVKEIRMFGYDLIKKINVVVEVPIHKGIDLIMRQPRSKGQTLIEVFMITVDRR